MRQVYLLTLLFCWATLLLAQDETYYEYPKHLEFYHKKDVKQYCWVENGYKASDNDYPEEWNEQSAILLRYEKRYSTRTVGGNSEMTIGYIGHYRIKLLDQAAVENFSEIYYSKEPHGAYDYENYGSRYDEFLGIKIIKPDGTEIEVSDQDIIIDDEGKRKVAVPNLEAGDILDYFMFSSDRSSYYEYSLIDQFVVQASYPIKTMRYSLKTDEDWDVQFASGEHALELNARADNARLAFYFEIEKENIERNKAAWWNYRYRNTSYIRMYVKHKKGILTERYKKKEQLYTSALDESDITKAYQEHYQPTWRAGNEYGTYKRYMRRKYGKEVKNLSKLVQLEELYYSIRHQLINNDYLIRSFYKMNYQQVSDKEFTAHLIYGLKRLKIPYELLVVVPRESGRLEDIINKEQTEYLIRAKLPEKDVYMYSPSPFTRFNRLPPSVESTDTYVLSAKTADQRSREVKIEKTFIDPSSYKDNIGKYTTKVSFDDSDKKRLKASTEVELTGHLIERYQYDVIDWVTLLRNEHKVYNTAEWKMYGYPSPTVKKQETYKENRAAKRQERQKEMVDNHFDIGDKAILTDFEEYTSANAPGEQSLKFRFDCDLEDLVKKVGPNYILKLGQLVGGQLTLEQEDMTREVDVYMDYPRGFEYQVTVEIPAGYEVKGLDNFKLKIDNQAGALFSEAVQEGNQVILTFKKYYKNNYEPKENWDQMKAFLVPGAEFISKELLLKKSPK